MRDLVGNSDYILVLNTLHIDVFGGRYPFLGDESLSSQSETELLLHLEFLPHVTP